MIAGGGEDGAGHHIVRLREFAESHFGLAALVIDELHRPASRYISVVAGGSVEKPVLIAERGVHWYVLVLLIEFHQENLAFEFIALGIGFEDVQITGHGDFEVRTRNLYVVDLQPLRAVDQEAYRLAVLLRQFKTEGQFSARGLQHDAISAHLDVIIHGLRGGGVRLAALAGGSNNRDAENSAA